MPDVNRIGFTELSGSDEDSDHSQGPKKVQYGRLLDFGKLVLSSDSIILIHGLRGHPVKTWASSEPAENNRVVGSSSRREHVTSFFKSQISTSRTKNKQTYTSSQQQQTFWPQDYLSKDVSQARVWTYGYNADVIGGLFKANNKTSVSGHGRDLAVRLEREIDDKALCRSKAYCQRTRLIVFLGTPHRGSERADWGKIASNLARLVLQDSNKKIVKALEVDSEVLDNIHEQFMDIVSKHCIKIHSFHEARGISGMKGLDEKVVAEFSSKVGLPEFETVESIDANHTQMAKCNDRSDENYRAIVGVIKQFLKRGSLSADLLIRSVSQSQGNETPGVQREGEAPCATPPYYSIPFLRNRRFIGRTTKLKELEEKLMISKDCRKLALFGLRGVGKTQIALELAYTVKERWPEYSIFWVPAPSAESFEQAYRDIASRCSIVLNPKEEDPKESVRRYLNSSSVGKWLLVVDNSDDEEILFGASDELGGITEYLPESSTGLTLFTTRHRQVAVMLAGRDVVKIQEMDREEAESFLTRSLTRTEGLHDRTVITELLEELMNLPLAIA
ncbi:MAG: hypothetical protein Q9163_002460 [Psora crenata]